MSFTDAILTRFNPSEVILASDQATATSGGAGLLTLFNSQFLLSASQLGYYLSQAKYAIDLISKARLTDSKIESTPLDLDVKLIAFNGQPLSNPTLY